MVAEVPDFLQIQIVNQPSAIAGQSVMVTVLMACRPGGNSPGCGLVSRRQFPPCSSRFGLLRFNFRMLCMSASRQAASSQAEAVRSRIEIRNTMRTSSTGPGCPAATALLMYIAGDDGVGFSVSLSHSFPLTVAVTMRCNLS